MGGDRARTQAQVEQPVVQKPKKDRRNRGGFFGSNSPTAQDSFLPQSTGSRGAFLGGGSYG